jgi:hypothetical protein
MAESPGSATERSQAFAAASGKVVRWRSRPARLVCRSCILCHFNLQSSGLVLFRHGILENRCARCILKVSIVRNATSGPLFFSLSRQMPRSYTHFARDPGWVRLCSDEPGTVQPSAGRAWRAGSRHRWADSQSHRHPAANRSSTSASPFEEPLCLRCCLQLLCLLQKLAGFLSNVLVKDGRELNEIPRLPQQLPLLVLAVFLSNQHQRRG